MTNAQLLLVLALTVLLVAWVTWWRWVHKKWEEQTNKRVDARDTLIDDFQKQIRELHIEASGLRQERRELEKANLELSRERVELLGRIEQHQMADAVFAGLRPNRPVEEEDTDHEPGTFRAIHRTVIAGIILDPGQYFVYTRDSFVFPDSIVNLATGDEMGYLAQLGRQLSEGLVIRVPEAQDYMKRGPAEVALDMLRIHLSGTSLPSDPEPLPSSTAFQRLDHGDIWDANS